MHNPRHPQVLPVRAGVSPSCVVLPTRGQGSMLDFLAQRLPMVAREQWRQRMHAGDVVDERGRCVAPEQPFEGGLRLYYYRSLSAEPVLPFAPTLLHQDPHLVVADKPHFMPVTPSGRYLQHTLLVRLKRQLGLPQLSPGHRIDRDTAGLVLLSVHQCTRGAYQALLRQRRTTKHYEAIAPSRVAVATLGAATPPGRVAVPVWLAADHQALRGNCALARGLGFPPRSHEPHRAWPAVLSHAGGAGPAQQPHPYATAGGGRRLGALPPVPEHRQAASAAGAYGGPGLAAAQRSVLPGGRRPAPGGLFAAVAVAGARAGVRRSAQR